MMPSTRAVVAAVALLIVSPALAADTPTEAVAWPLPSAWEQAGAWADIPPSAGWPAGSLDPHARSEPAWSQLVAVEVLGHVAALCDASDAERNRVFPPQPLSGHRVDLAPLDVDAMARSARGGRARRRVGVAVTERVQRGEGVSEDPPSQAPTADTALPIPRPPARRRSLPVREARVNAEAPGVDVVAIESTGLTLTALGIGSHLFGPGGVAVGDYDVQLIDGMTAMQVTTLGNALTASGVMIDADRLTRAGLSPRTQLGAASLGMSMGGHGIHAVSSAGGLGYQDPVGYAGIWTVAVAAQITSFGLGIAGIVDNATVRRNHRRTVLGAALDVAPMWLDDGGGAALTGRW